MRFPVKNGNRFFCLAFFILRKKSSLRKVELRFLTRLWILTKEPKRGLDKKGGIGIGRKKVKTIKKSF